MDNSKVNKQIGTVLRARRHQLGLSQEVVAEKIGISFQQLQKYEVGLNSLTIPRALDLCKALGLHLGDLSPKDAEAASEMSVLPITLAKNLHKLSEEGRATVMALVRSLAKQSEATT